MVALADLTRSNIPGHDETGTTGEVCRPTVDTLTAWIVNSSTVSPAKARKIAKAAVVAPDPHAAARAGIARAGAFRAALEAVRAADREHGRPLDHADTTGEEATWRVLLGGGVHA